MVWFRFSEQFGSFDEIAVLDRVQYSIFTSTSMQHLFHVAVYAVVRQNSSRIWSMECRMYNDICMHNA